MLQERYGQFYGFEGIGGNPGEIRNPNDFLRFLRENITIEDLFTDRPAQATLARIMDDHFSQDKRVVDELNKRGLLVVQNPYPVLELRSPDGNRILSINQEFQLKDRKHYYFFHDWYPTDETPPYLRSEDVVPSGINRPTYPHEVQERIMKTLDITVEQFRYLIYVQHPAVTQHAVLVDIPFNKPINRVPTTGGTAERYNYVTQHWEENGDGIYTPGVRTRIRSKFAELSATPRNVFKKRQ